MITQPKLSEKPQAGHPARGGPISGHPPRTGWSRHPGPGAIGPTPLHPYSETTATRTLTRPPPGPTGHRVVEGRSAPPAGSQPADRLSATALRALTTPGTNGVSATIYPRRPFTTSDTPWGRTPLCPLCPDRVVWRSPASVRTNFIFRWPLMTNPGRPTRPKGLGIAGSRVWRRVTEDYELRVDELILLEHACRTVDILARLEAAMQDQPLTVKGSMGQQREHPLLSEARQQRVLAARLLRQLDLPFPDDISDYRATARASAGRALARQRWGRY